MTPQEQPDSQAETLEQAAQGTPFEGQFDGNKIRSNSQTEDELDAIIKDYSDACIQTGLNAIDGNLEPVTLPNGLTLKQAIKAWSQRREVAARLDELEQVASYIGIRQSELADPYNGHNTYRSRIEKTLQFRLKQLTSDRTGGGEGEE